MGAGRDEITTGLSAPIALAFAGGRAYVADIGSNKIISYPVEADGRLGAGRDEITNLFRPTALAFSGGRMYVADEDLDKIISYPVGAGGELSAGRDEITTGLSAPNALAFSGGRAYVADRILDKIISYPVEASGELGAGRDEITTGLDAPLALAFSGGRAYVGDYGLDKIISYPVGAGGELGAGRDEITIGLSAPDALAFSGGRAYVGDYDLDKIISYPLFSTVAFAVAPDAPRVVAQSESEIEIAWNAVLGATHYKLYRSETSGGTFAQVGIDISITRYRDDNLSANTSYYYQLEACSGDECSGRSSEVSVTTALSIPSSAAATTQSDSAISIKWSAVAGATHYKLYRATASGGTYMRIGGKIAATGYLDTGLSVATAYYYRLEACNSGGCSERSLEVSAATYGSLGGLRDEITIGLDAPRALAFSGGRIYVVSNSKIISYPVEAGGELGAGRDEITTGSSSPRDLAFSGGRVYVVGYNPTKIISYPVGAGGEFGAGRDEITTGLFSPVALAFSGGRVYVADISSDKIVSYPVGAGGELGAGRDEIMTGLTNLTALEFLGGRAYVAKHDLFGNQNKIISYPVGANGELGAERDEITTGLRNPVALAFSGGRAYVLDSETAGNEDKIISYPVGTDGVLGAARDEATGLGFLRDLALSFPIAIAFSGDRAYVADSRLNKIVSYPLFSSVRFAVAPDAPRVFAQSDSEIEIAWNEVWGATHYKLYRATVSGGAYTQIGGEIAATGYPDSNLSESTAYYYQLEACNSGGCSGRSPEVLTTTYAEGSLGAGRDEITTGLGNPFALAFSGGRAYVADNRKIISYPVGANGRLGSLRDEITTGLREPEALAFSGGRAYVVDAGLDKIISYPVEAGGELGAGRDEITTGLDEPHPLAFSGGRAYVVDAGLGKIISYPVGAGGELGAGRDEITTGLTVPRALAFSGGRAYVVDAGLDKIISYPVEAEGRLGTGRNEITAGLDLPIALAFSGDRVYVADYGLDKIISYPVEADGSLDAGRDEITAGLDLPIALAFSGDRVYVADYGLNKIISYPVFSSVAFAVAPDAPRVFAQSESEIEIAWNAVLGATHYKLYRSETSGGTFAQVGVEISITRYQDDNLSADTSYYYQLEACSGDECSGRSPEVSTSTYGSLGAGRDEITGLSYPNALAFSGDRAYVLDRAKIISYAVGADGGLGVARDEITTGLSAPRALAFSGGRVYVADSYLGKIISYAVGADGVLGAGRDETNGVLGAGRDEIISDFPAPYALAFAGGRAYVVDYGLKKITSYPVGADGILGGRRNEITAGLNDPYALVFSGGRAYVADVALNKITSYPVGAGGELGAGRNEITTGLSTPLALAFAGGRVYVVSDNKIISYVVGADGRLGATRDEITAGLSYPNALAFSGERAYVVDSGLDKIISYPLFSSVAFAVAPDAPRVFAQSDSEIEIAWNAVFGATHYKLYRSETSGGTYTQVGGDISITRYRDGGLSANISYYYQLEACSGDECSGRSPTTRTAPAATATAQSDSEISITWSAVSGATHYKLYRATVSGGPYTQIGGNIAAIGYLDSGLSVKTAYYYQLEACNSGGCSERSFEISVATYGSLGAARDETTGLSEPLALAFSGGRVYVSEYVMDSDIGKIISYTVRADGGLGVARDEITTGLSYPNALAFSGGRAYVVDIDLFGNEDNKIVSYAVGEDGRLGVARDEITTGLSTPRALAFSGGRVYVVDYDFGNEDKIISYAVGSNGRLGAARDEITTGLRGPSALAFSGGRAYVADFILNKIISYAVGADGGLGVARDEITTGLSDPIAIAFAGGRVYVADYDDDLDLDGKYFPGKIISYAVGAGGILGAVREEITAGLFVPSALAFSGGRAYVVNYYRHLDFSRQ